jgi:hypothetical protein
MCLEYHRKETNRGESLRDEESLRRERIKICPDEEKFPEPGKKKLQTHKKTVQHTRIHGIPSRFYIYTYIYIYIYSPTFKYCS